MDILIVIGILLLAVIFILIELFLIPGLSIAGITGIALAAVSVWYAYSHVSVLAGNLALAGSFILTAAAVWVFVKSRALERMSLKTNVTGIVEKIDEELIKVGDKGVSMSRLAPMGKVRINNEIMEAKTNDEFIDQGVEIVVIEVYKTNVLVERATKEE